MCVVFCFCFFKPAIDILCTGSYVNISFLWSGKVGLLPYMFNFIINCQTFPNRCILYFVSHQEEMSVPVTPLLTINIVSVMIMP